MKCQNIVSFPKPKHLQTTGFVQSTVQNKGCAVWRGIEIVSFFAFLLLFSNFMITSNSCNNMGPRYMNKPVEWYVLTCSIDYL